MDKVKLDLIYNFLSSSIVLIFRFILISIFINLGLLYEVGIFNFHLVLAATLVIICKMGSDLQLNLISNQRKKVNFYDFILCSAPVFVVTIILFFFKNILETYILKDLSILSFLYLFSLMYFLQLIVPIFQGLNKFLILLLINFFSITISFVSYILVFNDLIPTWAFFQLIFVITSLFYLKSNGFFYFKIIKFKKTIIFSGFQNFTLIQILNNLILKIDVIAIRFIYPNFLGIYTTLTSLNEVFYMIPRAYSSLQINDLNSNKNPIHKDVLYLSVIWLIFIVSSYFLGNLFFDSLPKNNIYIFIIIGISVLIYSIVILEIHRNIIFLKKKIIISLIFGLIIESILLALIYLFEIDNLIFFNFSVLFSYLISLLNLKYANRFKNS